MKEHETQHKGLRELERAARFKEIVMLRQKNILYLQKSIKIYSYQCIIIEISFFHCIYSKNQRDKDNFFSIPV